MHRPPPRLTAVLGVVKAMLATLGPEDALDVLLAEFGWDVTFSTLALIREPVAQRAFGLAWQRLLLDPIEADLRVWTA